MKSIRHIFILLFVLLLSPLATFAQQSIDSAVKALESSKSVTNEVYSERRSPKSREILRSDRVFNFTDAKIAEKIIEAIRKERNKASAFKMNTTKGRAVYTITFNNPKGPYAKYTLMQRGNTWIMSVIKGSSKSRDFDDDSSMLIDLDGCDSDVAYEFQDPDFCDSNQVVISVTQETAKAMRRAAREIRKEARENRKAARKERTSRQNNRVVRTSFSTSTSTSTSDDDDDHSSYTVTYIHS